MGNITLVNALVEAMTGRRVFLADSDEEMSTDDEEWGDQPTATQVGDLPQIVVFYPK